MASKQLSILPIVMLLSILVGCGDRNETVGPEEHESRSVDLDKSEKVRVVIKMAFGELNVGGGTDKLLEADFGYTDAALKPHVQYRSSAGVGDLTVETRAGSPSGGSLKNRWDLRLNDRVPVDLRVELGAGEADMNVGTLSIRSAEVMVGAGTLRLDLRGNPVKDYSVRVTGGVGDATVYLPKDVGVSAKASGGLGEVSVRGLHKSGESYRNDAWDRAGVRIRLDIQGGVGSIKLISE
jgi:predicted membrane protein